MAHVLIVTPDTSHLAATRSKAAFESRGHTVTAIAESTIGSASLAGVDVIATVRPTRTTVRAWLSARWTEGYPLLIGGAESGVSSGTTAHTARDLGMLTASQTFSDTLPQAFALVSPYGLRAVTAHPSMTGYAVGSQTPVMAASNWVVTEYAASAAYGVEVGDAFISSTDYGVALQAFEAGAAINAAAASAPGATAPARAVFCGWLYAGQSDYTADGKKILGQSVDWLADTPAVAERTAAFTGSGAFSFAASATHTRTLDLTGSGAFGFEVAGSQARSLDLTGSGAFSFAVEIPEPTPTTDTTNRIGGRRRSGYGIATWSPAVVPAPASAAQAQAVVTAAAHGPVTMQGTQPVYTTSSASLPRGRQRIIVGGVDITYFRDVPTPDVDYQLAEPLLYGPATLTLPQVNPAHETLGKGELKWLRPGKKVVVQRVVNDMVVATDYKGVIAAFDTDGANLRVEIGGEAQGRAALPQVQLRIFDVDRDIGQLAYRAITSLGLPFTPRYGPTTGIRIGRFGGMGHLDYIQELCARAWTRAGTQWSIMPGDDGRYEMARKDMSTVHFTVFTDDARSVASLRRDIAEEPNRIYVTGVTPEGQRVRFGAYPGLKQGRAPEYPMAGGTSFGVGTTDADTIGGDGVSVMLARLEVFGYIGRRDKPGGYDADAAAAVEAVQEDANLAATGTMNEATWAALFDLDVTGYSLSMANIRPAAQRRTTHKWIYSASGAIMGLNPHYDPSVLKVDRNVDMGAGFTRSQMREWARAELQREANWVGTITLHTGAVLRGQIAEGATVTAADVMDARDIRPGMNAWLPQFDGGILLHVSGVDFNDDGTLRLTVDTQARDAAPIWQIIERNRETRRSPARRWMGNRSSSEIKDSIDIWDEVGGYLYNNVELVAGWNVVPIIAGQEGTVSRLRVELGTAAEFACAVFGRDVSGKRLNHLVPDPLTVAGTERWEKKAVRDTLDDLLLLYSAGTNEEPCGYSPGRKSGSAPLRGVHRDEASFAYRCRVGRPVLTLAVWVPATNTLKRGRVMWNQLEVGY